MALGLACAMTSLPAEQASVRTLGNRERAAARQARTTRIAPRHLGRCSRPAALTCEEALDRAHRSSAPPSGAVAIRRIRLPRNTPQISRWSALLDAHRKGPAGERPLASSPGIHPPVVAGRPWSTTSRMTARCWRGGFRRRGYEVLEADDGPQALELIKRAARRGPARHRHAGDGRLRWRSEQGREPASASPTCRS